MSREYCDYVVDLLSSWGPVSAKAMFGAYGLYRQGQMFAIVDDDTLYFKVGDDNRPDYEATGSSPLTYESKGKQIALSYWRVPDEALDDPETLSEWAEKAYRVALAQRQRKKK